MTLELNGCKALQQLAANQRTRAGESLPSSLWSDKEQEKVTAAASGGQT